MKRYIPDFPFSVPMYLLIPSVEDVKGVTVKRYPEPSDEMLFFGSFRTFGGTESVNNGLYSVIDTATVEAWFNPEIKADCRICLADNPEKQYEIIGTPENINMQGQFLKFKVQAVRGGA